MKHQRVLSKAAITPTHLYILGGNKTNNGTSSCEIMDRKTGEWKLQEVTRMNIIGNWKCYAYSNSTIFVTDGPAQPRTLPFFNDYSSISCIFGTDDEPFIIYVKHKGMKSYVQPCPINLKLKNYQAVCRIDDENVFIGGGINRELKKIFNRCYIFNIKTMEVTECESMHGIRYTFPAVYCNVKKYYSNF